MRNLRKFNTEAEYSAATLNYPAVSWIVSGDTVVYDKTEPVVAEDKVIMAFTSANAGENIVLYDENVLESPFTSITVNDDAIDPIVPVLEEASEANTDYLVEYGFEGTDIPEAFNASLGILGSNSEIELLVPAQIEDVDYLPTNQITNLVFKGATPPSTSIGSSSIYYIYVPDDALEDYQNSMWSGMCESLRAMSRYDGNLPV